MKLLTLLIDVKLSSAPSLEQFPQRMHRSRVICELSQQLVPPPWTLARFPLMVDPVIMGLEPFRLAIPAPLPPAFPVIMQSVTNKCREDAGALGIEVVDVRIKRADLPQENKKNVFDRMRAERARQAKEYRAEGEEAAIKIRAETDLEVTRIQSEANLQAQRLRGDGDAEALRIYADAFQKDPQFYEFQRTLEAYEKTLGEGTTVVLPLDTEFFKYLGTGK